MVREKKPTLKEIAELAGVTKATVSLVLNNTGRVSQELREKVKRIADELDYRPNVIAQGLARQHMKLIGMVIPSFHDDFSHEVFLGIENYAKERGYKILVGLTNNEGAAEDSIIEEFLQLNSAGLIIQPSPQVDSKERMYRKLMQEKVPFAFYTRYPLDGNTDYNRVLCDDVLGGRLAVQHLIEKGHQRIAFYTNRYVKGTNDTINKRKGYELAHQQAGLPVDPQLTISSDMFSDERPISDWVREHGVTAIFVSTDYSAINIMEKLQNNGIRIPEDVAIVGYDDIRMAKLCTPKLTTVRVPKKEIGMKTAEMVLSMIEHPIKRHQHEVIEMPELVIRRSS
ncbi:LacI family DNA-binding transcriptional regulator [Paenibacillus roseipurpureus]|uniref:LacI family DNA-binding transcriptional regulator n=1 Tax=Paenibacillus roseopurpureus TaxID=2918901 RepID=A0AA96RJI7_9BACL|nr:LacI family DNA-binding transcriptional regulator [Paenibacillus sp. MBLB1832]WNR45423.1 LacI family DNA-binding transcriptional regulator [Paenibacillus sp. MBLB1832]